MFHSCFDTSRIDFLSAVESIRDGKSILSQSRLYRFLKPEIRHKINAAAPLLQNQIDMLKTAYEFDNILPFWDGLDFSESVAMEGYVTDKMEFIRERQIEHKLAISRRDWLSFDRCVLQHGTSRLTQFAILLTMKKYHMEFEIDDFLCTWVSTDKPKIKIPNSITQQMIASRINYILHGSYLPIVTIINSNVHTTAYLMMPSVSDEILTWNIIHVNSNGAKSDNHLIGFFDDSLAYYQSWAEQNQIQTKTLKRSLFCWENIQKDYGTCSIWALILSVQFLADFKQFHSRAGGDDHDSIDIFCKELSKRLSFYVIINRFNHYIGDLSLSFRHLIIEMVDKVGRMNVKTLPDFEKAILSEPESKTIILDQAIFRQVKKIRKHLQKYNDNFAKIRKIGNVKDA